MASEHFGVKAILDVDDHKDGAAAVEEMRMHQAPLPGGKPKTQIQNPKGVPRLPPPGGAGRGNPIGIWKLGLGISRPPRRCTLECSNSMDMPG